MDIIDTSFTETSNMIYFHSESNKSSNKRSIF